MIYLLSLDHEQAVQDSIPHRDSLAGVTPDGPATSTTSEEWDPVPTIARWAEVHRARARVVRGKLASEVLALRAAGASEQEVAQATGLSHSTARRRFHAKVDEILELLGGEDEQPERVSIPSACMPCGRNPRGRVVTRRRQLVAGQRRAVVLDRASSLCESCRERAAAAGTLQRRAAA